MSNSGTTIFPDAAFARSTEPPDCHALIDAYNAAFSSKQGRIVDEAAIDAFNSLPNYAAASDSHPRLHVDMFTSRANTKDILSAFLIPASSLDYRELTLLVQPEAYTMTDVAPTGAIIEAKPAHLIWTYVTWAYWKPKLTSLWLKQFVAGGIAGGVSRTVTSPLERIKILFQIQTSTAHYNGVWPTLMKIYSEEGWKGYFRGNGTNVIRIVPYSAVQFAAYEKYKRMLMEPGKTELDTKRRLTAGAGAGITSVACTYPLDIVRTRLSVQSAAIGKEATGRREMDGIWVTMKRMYQQEGGVRALYRGLGPTLTGVAPYIALNFQFYEVLRKHFTKPGESGPTHINKLLCGALAGTIAQTCTYPLDVLRRRMQVTGMKETEFEFKNAWDALYQTIKKEKIRGLYKGMVPNYLKVAPAIGVSFWTYEFTKSLLGC